MNRIRMFAFAVAVFVVVAIASYYLFGGPLKLSLFFPAPTFYQPAYNRIPPLNPATPGPQFSPAPHPLPSSTKRPHPSMRTGTRTDVLLHVSPAPYVPVPVNLVTPPPAPTYAPVTPPPYTPAKPVIMLPQTAGSPGAGMSPSPAATP
jgi:hypothetical protein